MSYRLSRRAKEDLIQIYVSSVEAFGVAQAERYQDALQAAFDLITEFPQLARERSELQPPVRVHPCRSHIIIYLVDDKGPFIVRIRHGSADWEAAPVSG